jgi:glycerol uptake facilitator-like aquaporin
MDCNYRSMGICRFLLVAVAGPKRRPFNPIVTLGLAFVGKFAWSQVVHIVAQMIELC